MCIRVCIHIDMKCFLINHKYTQKEEKRKVCTEFPLEVSLYCYVIFITSSTILPYSAPSAGAPLLPFPNLDCVSMIVPSLYRQTSHTTFWRGQWLWMNWVPLCLPLPSISWCTGKKPDFGRICPPRCQRYHTLCRLVQLVQRVTYITNYITNYITI